MSKRDGSPIRELLQELKRLISSNGSNSNSNPNSVNPAEIVEWDDDTDDEIYNFEELFDAFITYLEEALELLNSYRSNPEPLRSEEIEELLSKIISDIGEIIELFVEREEELQEYNEHLNSIDSLVRLIGEEIGQLLEERGEESQDFTQRIGGLLSDINLRRDELVTMSTQTVNTEENEAVENTAAVEDIRNREEDLEIEDEISAALSAGGTGEEYFSTWAEIGSDTQQEENSSTDNRTWDYPSDTNSPNSDWAQSEEERDAWFYPSEETVYFDGLGREALPADWELTASDSNVYRSTREALPENLREAGDDGYYGDDESDVVSAAAIPESYHTTCGEDASSITAASASADNSTRLVDVDKIFLNTHDANSTEEKATAACLLQLELSGITNLSE